MRARRGWLAAGIALSLISGPSVTGTAQETKASKASGVAKAKESAERVAGVIVKVEPLAKAPTAGVSSRREKRADKDGKVLPVRLTINMAAVWKDWARDQNSGDPSESAKKEATDGANSIATKGEPQDKDTLVVVDLTHEGRIETRFRTPDDETTKGAKTPAEARRSDDPADTRPAPPDSKHATAKPTHFTAATLKPGLFVEIDFKHLDSTNIASTVTVIRPVYPESPAKPASR
ncbi:hypothetical protein ACYOEI_14890 [Singulisphaera rosea]